MGYRQTMTRKQQVEWDSMQYNAKKEANKGHNYPYWNEWDDNVLMAKGYTWFTFDNFTDSTQSEYAAIEIVKNLRENGNYARIICGMNQNVQRVKMFSIVFKPKKP